MLRNAFSRARAVRRDESGFTLIELLIVIVILGVLAGIVVFSVQGLTDRGDLSACKSEVKTFATAEEAYYAKNGSYGTISQLQSGGFIRGTETPKYVASMNASTGAMTLTAAAPAGCTAA